MQLVVSGNRVLATGNDCFICMGGTVVCPEDGRVWQNATVVTECEGCPSDIDSVAYEYHEGEFAPCATQCRTYNVTVGTIWTGTEAPYTQDIAVNGIFEVDTPIVALVPSNTYATAKAEMKAWAKVYRITTSLNKITVYATGETDTAFNLQIKAVR